MDLKKYLITGRRIKNLFWSGRSYSIGDSSETPTIETVVDRVEISTGGVAQPSQHSAILEDNAGAASDELNSTNLQTSSEACVLTSCQSEFGTST